MDRRAEHGTVSGSSVQTSERPALQLLLQESACQTFRAAAHASCRRDLYGTAVFGLTQDCSGIEEGGLRRQSQAYPEGYAAIGAGRQSAWPQYVKAASGAHQISLFAKWCDIGSTAGRLEHRYHVYPAPKWICVSRRCDRLVQPPRTVLPALQQLGGELLSRCLRRSYRTAWIAQNFQHRPGCAIHLKRVCSGSYWPRHSLQHGWARSGLGQRVCGTAMEVSEV